MKQYLLLLPLLWNAFSYAQVGIGTDQPKATLDVNGNLMVRDVTTANSVTNHSILVLENNEIKKVEASSIIGGNGNVNNSIAFLASRKDQLLKNDLIPLNISNWKRINLQPNDATIGQTNSNNNAEYVIQSSGVYQITYELELLGPINYNYFSTKKIALFKNNNILSEKNFKTLGFSYSDPNLTSFNNTIISKLFRLEKDDILIFAADIEFGFSYAEDSKYEATVNLFKVSE
ncbi:MAG: hypothetical protein KBS93_03020 [Flavobacteriaceae bacterium]|nr:hypothetical protein [Candidatus Onthonaster equi]